MRFELIQPYAESLSLKQYYVNRPVHMKYAAHPCAFVF